MTPHCLKSWASLMVVVLFAASARAADPSPSPLRISEILVSNANGIADEDGERHGWVEIENTTQTTLDLSGYHLTDDSRRLTLWTFPQTQIPPRQFLIVFCSGKNRSAPQKNLHSNFILRPRGGWVGLVAPDGRTLVSELTYGQQYPDIAFGLGLGPSFNTSSLTGAQPSLQYLIPSSELDASWRSEAQFELASWKSGTFPAGYDRGGSPPTIAYQAAPGTPGNQAFSGTLGLDFDVTRPIQITELGCFDDLGDGIATNVTITVQLFRRINNGTPALPGDDRNGGVVFSTNFTFAASGNLTGAFRFKSVPVPITLTNGSYTIAASGYSARERLANLNSGVSVVLPDSRGGVLKFVGSSRYSDSARTFPTAIDSHVAQYAAGTFAFRPLPDSSFKTSLVDMAGTNATVLVRIPFQVPAAFRPFGLQLQARYDDGFVAWLNGVEIARRNAPDSLAFNSHATQSGLFSETLDLSRFISSLIPGTNLLAIQGLNLVPDDPDFTLNFELTAEQSIPGNVYLPTPTPGTTNGDGVLSPHLVINEIHSDPILSKSFPLEFIELYNPTSDTISLSGWRFSRGVDYLFPSGTQIPPRSYLVIAQRPDLILSRFGVPALGPWSGSLSNEGEVIELDDSNGVVVDQVEYGLGFPWPTVGDNDFSLQRLNEGVDGSLGGSWRGALPTPGQRNTVTTADPPPSIRQVEHQPRQPTSAQPVLVSAKITDSSRIASVQLLYQIVEPGNYLRLSDPEYATQWVPLEMNDAGTDGDSSAGDSIFSVTLPASIQTHRRLIRYRITALDMTGHSIRVPYPDDPSPNFAYFVYDGVPAWTGAVQPGVTPASTFGTETMRKVRAWHMISRSNDVLRCQYDSAFNDEVYRFEGAFVVGDRVYDHIRYRPKGQNSTYNTGKNKWKIKFNTGHLLEMPDDYDRQTTVIETLNVSSLPSSWAPWNRGMAGLDEVIQYRLSNLVGVPAPRTTYFQLRVIDSAVEQPSNTQYDGDFWGLYIGFENQDNRFKQAHDLPDGNIFRLQSGNTHLLGQGAGQPTDLRDLNAFISSSTGYNRSPVQPESWWRTNVHLPMYYSWRAVNEAVNNTDIRDQENVVYFRDPTTGLWHIEPWDCDLLYEQLDRWGPEATQSSVPYEQIRKGLSVTNILVEFKNRARELQDLLLNQDQAWKLIDEYLSLITDGGPIFPGFVEADRRRWDYNPINPIPPRGVGAFGNYYKSPYPIPDMGQGPPQPFYRILTTPDFDGLVTWVKNFIAFDPHGGARLAKLALDDSIPVTPQIRYVGDAGFPADDLPFEISTFQSPTNRTFVAVQWRIAEVSDPSVPGFQHGHPWRYEIEEVWNSGDLTQISSPQIIPREFVQAGHTYRARAKFKDSSGRWSHWSAPISFTVGSDGVTQLQQSLILSEVMYHPAPFEGINPDRLEFLELKNIGAESISLEGLSFTEGISYAFSSATRLNSGETFLLVRDAAAFGTRYPGLAFQGVFSGRLDDGGETITLSHRSGGVIFSIAYSDEEPWPITADGMGFSLVPRNDPIHGEPSDPRYWRSSLLPGGSPGASEASSPQDPAVYIEEVLSHGGANPEFIELHHAGDGIVDISGWFLTDNPTQPRKFRIPANTQLGPGEFRVFYEQDFNPSPTTTNNVVLSAQGEVVYLLATDSLGNWTGYSHGFRYGATESDQSQGRFTLITGEEVVVAQEVASPGRTNQGPRIPPVVISEIHYHPSDSRQQFVEVWNVSNLPIPLFHPSDPTHTWRLEGLDFEFPTQVTLPPGSRLLIVSGDPVLFRNQYDVPLSVPIFGPFQGRLSRDGERLRLQRPVDFGNDEWAHVTVDEVRFADSGYWPSSADGSGASLQRVSPNGLGLEPTSWDAFAPNPGFGPASGNPPRIILQPRSLHALPGQSIAFQAEAQGSAPLFYQWKLNGAALPNATLPTLKIESVSALDAGAYQVFVFNSSGSIASDIVFLQLDSPLLILNQPTNHFIRPGSNALFRVVASGTGPIRYQWFKDNVPIPGAETNILSIPNAQFHQEGFYRCQLKDDLSLAWSTPAQLQLLVEPVIVQAPVNQQVVAGGPLTLSVAVTNTATLPIGYRLRRNGQNVPGAFFVSNQRQFVITLTGTNASPPWTNFSFTVTNRAKAAGNTTASALISYLPDIDRDRLPDAWELRWFNGNSVAPDADADDDGVSNLDEYLTDTNPLDPSSLLRVEGSMIANGFQLHFNASSNLTYQIEFADDLTQGTWQSLKIIPARPIPAVEAIIDPLPPVLPHRYYRVQSPAVP